MVHSLQYPQSPSKCCQSPAEGGRWRFHGPGPLLRILAMALVHEITLTLCLGVSDLSSIIFCHLIQFTTSWWLTTQNDSAPLFAQMSRTYTHRSDGTIKKCITDLWLMLYWRHKPPSFNMVFIMDKLLYSQKSSNRTLLWFRSGSLDHTPPGLIVFAPSSLKSPSKTKESPGGVASRIPPQGLQEVWILWNLVWHIRADSSQDPWVCWSGSRAHIVCWGEPEYIYLWPHTVLPHQTHNPLHQVEILRGGIPRFNLTNMLQEDSLKILINLDRKPAFSLCKPGCDCCFSWSHVGSW